MSSASKPETSGLEIAMVKSARFSPFTGSEMVLSDLISILSLKSFLMSLDKEEGKAETTC